MGLDVLYFNLVDKVIILIWEIVAVFVVIVVDMVNLI